MELNQLCKEKNCSCFADVYVERIPDDLVIEKVYPNERNEEIENSDSEKVRKERFFVWKLLEYAINKTFNLKKENLHFEKQESGKWTCKECYFSLSHSHGAVAVAVSNSLVGVGIELFEKPKEKAIESRLTPSEKAELEKIDAENRWKYLITAWSKKESFFKAKGKGEFFPSKIDTKKNQIDSKIVVVGEKEYVLSICFENENINYHESEMRIDK